MQLMRLLSALALLGPAVAAADWQLNMEPGVTSISRAAYDLHMIVLTVCVVIGLGVFAVMFWSIVHHRKSKGATAAHFHESTTVEIVWTLVPFLILVGLAVPATKALIHIEDASDPDLSILVTGYQWKWHYQYLNDDIEFFSTLDAKSNAARQLGSGVEPGSVENYLLDVDNPVVIPVGKKVRFLTTSSDVIHAWWVPAFGFKRDAIPGFVNESWAKVEVPGVYRGQCAELCGRDHGFMPIVVEAKPEAEYLAWVSDFKAKAQAAKLANDPNRDWTLDDLVARGEQVYVAQCTACHTAEGGSAADGVPALTGGAVTIGAIEDHIDLLMFGAGDKSGFADKLNDIEIAAVITYARNRLGNAVGDTVQPSAIAGYR